VDAKRLGSPRSSNLDAGFGRPVKSPFMATNAANVAAVTKAVVRLNIRFS
jgi:hypothetical protein